MWEQLEKILCETGTAWLLAERITPDWSFDRSKAVCEYFDVIDENSKVLVYGDYDVDGLMSLLIWKRLLKDFGISFQCYEYSKRTHNIDYNAIHKTLTGNFTHMIISDTGSSTTDMESIRLLCASGVKVLVVDHHQTSFGYNDYPPNCTFINSTLNQGRKLVVSAGMLCFLCVYQLYIYYHKNPHKWIYAFALVSMYADGIDMGTELARSLYDIVIGFEAKELPVTLQHFMSQYDVIGKRYVTYSYAPKINALMRAERYDLVNDYLVRDNPARYAVELLGDINFVYETSRANVGTVCDIVSPKDIGNLVLVDITQAQTYVKDLQNMYNYTGLIANSIGNRYGKAAFVYCVRSDGTVKGSLRDPYNRNFLPMFKNFCNANGHNPAFGVMLHYKELEELLENINRVSMLLSSNPSVLSENKPNRIILPYNQSLPDKQLLNYIAYYNEFAGSSLPLGVLSKVWLDGSHKYTGYYHMYSWGDVWLKATEPLVQGMVLNIVPIKRKKLELKVENL